MKIKLKKGVVLPNNWKSCGCSAEDWADLNGGKSIEDNIDVVESASKIKKTGGK